jgi:hypothetical protein
LRELQPHGWLSASAVRACTTRTHGARPSSQKESSRAHSPWAPTGVCNRAHTVPIQEDHPKLKRLHASPDVYTISDFLSHDECEALVSKARTKGLEQSPVVYSGWTKDLGDILRLCAAGPAVWLALIPELNSSGKPVVETATAALGTWLLAMIGFGVLAFGFIKSQEGKMQALRTSTSVRMDAATPGAGEFVQRLQGLLQLPSAATFEGVDVIRYEPGQALKPHWDANREAVVEDKERGGQVLATALVYLNDVPSGGVTRFCRLGLDVAPKKGDCLLFFPADRNGRFDERTEHEGTDAVDEKWLARIWAHQLPVTDPKQSAAMGHHFDS